MPRTAKSASASQPARRPAALKPVAKSVAKSDAKSVAKARKQASIAPKTVAWDEFGFVRVAAAAPLVHIADPMANALEILQLAREADRRGATVVCFPELSLTGYTCEDLFLTSDLRQRTELAVEWLCAETANLQTTLVVGAPLQAADGRRYNVALVIHHGTVFGAIPKLHLPNYGEFYERRWFTPGHSVDTMVTLRGLQPFRLSSNQVFSFGPAVLGVEICEDLWAPEPPSGRLALAGATILVNPSASNELVAKAEYRRTLVNQQSARLHTAYVYAGAGPSESTKDVVFGGHLFVSENGTIVAENERFSFEAQLITTDIDIDRLANERGRNITWANTTADPAITVVPVGSVVPVRDLQRSFARTPFVPDDPRNVDERAAEIMAIQSTGLARRMMAANAKRAVIGVSGGLDSTLALLVTVETMRRLNLPVSNILGITMPGPGTTKRTRTAADDLMEQLGIEARTIPIGPSVAQHFKDIGHDPNDHSIVFENAQARERTQILFDVANAIQATVVGTGDLSELALGWCTFNADHMSQYGVNGSVPKTLVRHLVRWYARQRAGDATEATLIAIADTPVSPELLPPDADGNIVQETEEVVGPYELHDFFLFHFLRNGFAPQKIAALADLTFAELYEPAAITKWLGVFLNRFHRQQFKRTTLPPGPKVGSVSVSPRGDLRMPDEVDPASISRFLQDR